MFISVTPDKGYRVARISYAVKPQASSQTTNSQDAEESKDTNDPDLLYEKYGDLVNLFLYRDTQASESFSVDIPLVETSEGVYCLVMPEQDVDLQVTFEPIKYTITYVGGQNEKNPTSYTVESDIILLPAAKAGYEFLGWYDEVGTQVAEIKDSTGDLTLTAKWKENQQTAPVTNNADKTTPAPTEKTIGTAVSDYNPAPINQVMNELREIVKGNQASVSSEDTARVTSNGVTSNGVTRTIAARQVTQPEIRRISEG